MAGNVREWTRTWARAEDRFGPPEDQIAKIVKGGAWTSSEWSLTAWDRSWHYAEGWEPETGFRCAY